MADENIKDHTAHYMTTPDSVMVPINPDDQYATLLKQRENLLELLELTPDSEPLKTLLANVDEDIKVWEDAEGGP